ncbi:metal-dependent transcriptional regulator (plasmid) [Rubrobacter tropicus]|uniref:Manganese transport regulator n=2 Tax=Rubrobacter tropicus TaxID=2653851 RepID=A0A6G8QH09_9ACTN|nr:metal-dependent transcriptional regulator [Rubrobacter tropicus]
MDGATIPRSPSSSVGDYLKAIWESAEGGAASTKDVAERLSVNPASVTNMFARLRGMGLVEYERYRGASLTEEGLSEALRLVRRHRLIETFLLDHLGYSWEEVHEEAEKLEHAVSDRFTERLAELLGHPDHDPHGDPIPSADLSLAPEDLRPLGESAVGERVRVCRVSEDAGVLAHLGERGLVPGEELRVQEVRVLDGVVTVEDKDGVFHTLGPALAASIFVEPVGYGMG